MNTEPMMLQGIPRETNTIQQAIHSIFDDLNSKLAGALHLLLHGLKFFGRVALPVRDFVGHKKRMPRPVRQCGIAGKLLVGEVGVIFDRAGRLQPTKEVPDKTGLLYLNLSNFCLLRSSHAAARRLSACGLVGTSNPLNI